MYILGAHWWTLYGMVHIYRESMQKWYWEGCYLSKWHTMSLWLEVSWHQYMHKGTHCTCVSCCVGSRLPGVRPAVLDCSNAKSNISSALPTPVGNLKGRSHGELLAWRESNRATGAVQISFTFSTFSARRPLLIARTHRGMDMLQEMRYSMYTTSQSTHRILLHTHTYKLIHTNAPEASPPVLQKHTYNNVRTDRHTY